ncbi:GNAT family N-acetyltransferase [Methylomonas sp. AM2-LC]|uniref:GNAT family N-acetyltransferase n=1 Tax=Methylomonas sp. AM2-LC TaxID=3153301 RepID=UPI0032666C1B
MQIRQINSINEVTAADWNQWVEPGYPFIRHEFLQALEQSGAVSTETGWQVSHLLLYQNHELLAILPLYRKQHSQGEYVFDQQWAAAYHQYGLAYYPKLLTAIPFTPSQGQRVLIKPTCDNQAVISYFLSHIQQLAEHTHVSSWHCLFPAEQQFDQLRLAGLTIRQGVQFHWFNQSYQSFDDFLQSLTASKRKMLKRERRRVADEGIHLDSIEGKDITDEQWQVFFRFYVLTYQKKGAYAYLNLAFFRQIAASMAEQLLLVLAVKDGQYIAAALSFVGSDCLYGRYWGCEEDYSGLHFETCYYQGIDYCIKQGLQRFDSGAQGEHKIARGFQPVTTYSAHWLKDERFAQVIADFVGREQQMLADYKQDASTYLPFKCKSQN